MLAHRLVGRFITDEPDATAGGGDTEAGTYLPTSEVGSPRYMLERCADAMATVRQLGSPYLLFITMTTDLKDWPEISSRLAKLSAEKRTSSSPAGVQDPYDRAGLHSEVFHAKVQAFLARLENGTIFRNLGRPEVTLLPDGRRQYVYPMSMAGGGFMIVATEDQDRGRRPRAYRGRLGRVR